MASPLFGLIDCNNFYCSCERVFEPRLNDSPLIVASNNDGCVVARSEQVKALGVPMGIPLFKIKKLIEQYQIRVFSSNYALYADMSRRVQTVVAGYIPQHQIYSIDEIFLSLEDEVDPYQACVRLRHEVAKQTGIPTSVGLGPTKTLAKIANYHAKKNPRFSGVCDATNLAMRERLLKLTPVENIWGVGKALTQVCHRYSAKNAWELAQLDLHTARKAANIGLEKLIRELGGLSCYEIDTVPAHPKSCAVTRSFSQPITHLSDMLEAVANYATRAAEKCRNNQQLARAMQVFMTTGVHRDHYYSASLCAQMTPANADTRLFLRTARALAEGCFQEGFQYKKAGVILFDLTTAEQGALDFVDFDEKQSEQVMNTIDAINQRHGRNTVFFGAQGIERAWAMQRAHCSSHYTTDIEQVPIVKAT
ncbi:MAG: DNA polymerase V subunit UmuC [Legionellales bacterium]|nr:DNA polymerase V subunit UmuC [Legionellales bacterium]